MRIYRCPQGFIVIGVFLALVSCATTDLPSMGAGGKPFQRKKDEKELWQNAEELERRINKIGILYEDRKLEAYLDRVAKKLLGRNVQAQGLTPRIKVIRHPLLNAFALPHGVIYFHTGILARMENEAQLASVLGHELTHFTHRHALKEMRSAKNKAVFMGVLQVMLAAAAAGFSGSAQAGAMAGELAGEVGAIWTLASVRGYSRELETEADQEGLRTMIQAGYDPKEAIKVFNHLQQELDKGKTKEPFFFGTHPHLQERIENYRDLLDTEYAAQAKEGSRLKNEEEFLSQIAQVLLDNAVFDLQIGRLKTARAAIKKHLKRQPHSPGGYFLLGEIHRRSGDTQRAFATYQEAVRLDPTYAEPHRELGLLYRAQNRHEQACTEFERYLALSPNAVDAPIIEGYLGESEKP